MRCCIGFPIILQSHAHTGQATEFSNFQFSQKLYTEGGLAHADQ